MSISGYANDIFISHAWDHAAAWHDGDKEWIVRFHELLGARIKGQIGTAPSVYRDRPNLDREKEMWDALQEALRDSAMLLVVLSKPWLRSKWCPGELEFFLNQCRERDRVLVVEVDSVPSGELPTALRPRYRFKFWRDEDGAILPLKSHHDQYDVESTRLVDTLTKTLRNLKPETADQRPQSVYLAEVDQNDRMLKDAYDDVLQELRRDYVIEPGREFWYAPDGYQNDVEQALGRSAIFVQLLGQARSRPHPEAFHGFYERWLFEQAQQKGVKTLMWRHPTVDLDAVDEGEYKQFLEGNTVISCKLADFKQEVHQTLRSLRLRKSHLQRRRVAHTLLLKMHEADESRGNILAQELWGLDCEALFFDDFDEVREVIQQEVENNGNRNGCVVVHAECPKTESLNLLRPIRDLLNQFRPPQVKYAVWDDPSGPAPLRWWHPDVVRIEQPDAKQAAHAILKLWQEA